MAEEARECLTCCSTTSPAAQPGSLDYRGLRVNSAREWGVGYEPLWFLTKDGDRSCLALYRKHYSCRNKRPRQDQFVGPSYHIVLRTDDGDAVFVWRAAEYRADGQEGIECALFRNESPHLSSTLIRQADAVADHVWPGRRHYTFVSEADVRSTNPGFCFIAAGWRRCGKTEGGLIVLERLCTHTGAGRGMAEEARDDMIRTALGGDNGT